jgi:3-hydroxyisobutyrate dehydrogenase-like beta-hydroxyacid dehydrogenase
VRESRSCSAHTSTRSSLLQRAEGKCPYRNCGLRLILTSRDTLDRVKSAHISDVPTYEDLVAQTDIIFSIVPPRDAVANARRVVDACRSTSATTRAQRTPSLTYVDLNAISPKSAKTIASLISSEASPKLRRTRTSSFSFKSEPDIQSIPLQFLDGGIIGAPPSRQADKTWKCPSIVVSGPRAFSLDNDLSVILNVKHISDSIGPASTLKACFASLTKGFTALSILSFTTASACGVLPELQEHLAEFNPAGGAAAAKGLVAMPPKAYRWDDEMKEIGDTFAEVGGFGEGLGGKAVFEGISEIYQFVADGTELGREKTGSRKRGKTVEDVARAMTEGMRKRRRSGAGEDEDLSLTWRSSWS